jgi:putative cell wall-binding protein
MIGSLLVFVSPAAAPPVLAETDVETETFRVAGDNRYATAAAIALDDRWPNSTQTLVVVNGENFPDGLTAAGLQQIGNNGVPVLLVRADSIPPETAAAITELETTRSCAPCDGVAEIIVVGGTSVVSSAVLEALDALNGDQGVRRLAGADRYETAVEVAKFVNDEPCDVILATGENFPDALAAGPLSGWLGGGDCGDAEYGSPILLNRGAALLPDVKGYLATMTGSGKVGAPTVHIIGGTGAVPQSVEDEIRSMGLNVNRLGGATRDETAVAIADFLRSKAGNGGAVLVNRNGFADALAAGPFAGYLSRVILLTNVNSIPDATAARHQEDCDLLDEVNAIGGVAVVSDDVLTGAAAAAQCLPVAYTATLATLATTQIVFELLDDVDDGNVSSGAGLTFTGVPGSAADGAFGRSWEIAVRDSGGAPTGSVVDASGPSVTLSIKGFSETGISQADLVALWNGDPATSALFTAAVNASTGSPERYDGSATNMIVKTYGKTTQQVVVTFNQDVDSCSAPPANYVADAGDFTNMPQGTVVSSSPLPLTVGGEDVYTFTFDVEFGFGVRSVGDTIQVIGGFEVCSAATGLSSGTDPVELTAAS